MVLVNSDLVCLKVSLVREITELQEIPQPALLLLVFLNMMITTLFKRNTICSCLHSFVSIEAGGGRVWRQFMYMYDPFSQPDG